MSEPSPRTERLRGLVLLLGLHVTFTLMTWVIADRLPADDREANDVLRIWVRHLGLVQGIYAIPGAITIALVQRWQLLVGFGVGAGVTGLVTAISLLGG